MSSALVVSPARSLKVFGGPMLSAAGPSRPGRLPDGAPKSKSDSLKAADCQIDSTGRKTTLAGADRTVGSRPDMIAGAHELEGQDHRRFVRQVVLRRSEAGASLKEAEQYGALAGF